MRPMERTPTKPGRELSAFSQVVLRNAFAPQLIEDLRQTGVRMTAPGPFGTNRHPVARQRLFIPTPHADDGVMAPAVIRATDGPENLQHLDPLLPQPTIVEDGRGVPETRIREKSLHRR